MAIDSHMHINNIVLSYREQQEEITSINNNSKLETVINVGMNIETSKEVCKLAYEFKKFYASIGIHPLYLENEQIDLLYELAKNDKVVAIGEIGLDSNNINLDMQINYLVRQIEIANILKLPVIIHSNNMNKKVIEVFENYVKPQYGCVFHCFQPDLDSLDYLIKNGYYISFAGRITYKNAKKSLEVIKKVPNDLFLVETDSPYISPVPFRGEINHSIYIEYIIRKIAEVKKMDYFEIENLSSNNAKRLFKKLR